MIQIDPPGTILSKVIFSEIISAKKIDTFIEVGCGDAKYSEIVCKMGKAGYGIDFSKEAIKEASERMEFFISNQQYHLYYLDVMKESPKIKADLVFSLFVMEHIQEDIAFLKTLKTLLKPSGTLMIMVPARVDKWGIEDDTVGHIRRYSRNEIIEKFREVNLHCECVWSLGVPLVNILLHLSNLMIQTAGGQEQKNQPALLQTKGSGIRQIPYKTVFPSSFRFIFNKFTLYPFIMLQRLFVNTDFGLIILVTSHADDQAPNEPIMPR